MEPGHYITVKYQGNLAMCKRLVHAKNKFDIKEEELMNLKNVGFIESSRTHPMFYI